MIDDHGHDQFGGFTEDEWQQWREAVLARLSSSMRRSCELCGGPWKLANGLVTFNTFRSAGPDVGRDDLLAGLWYVVMGCHGCGNTKLINALDPHLGDLCHGPKKQESV